MVPYNIVKSDNNDAWVEVQDKNIPQSQISAYILQKMKETAESYLGEPVTKAVITVQPISMMLSVKQLKTLAKLLGLKC